MHLNILWKYSFVCNEYFITKAEEKKSQHRLEKLVILPRCQIIANAV